MVWLHMKHTSCAFLFILLVPTILCAQNPTGLPEKDSASIRRVVTGFADSYNRHDAQALARWFTQDADFTTTQGVTIHGRRLIDEHFEPLFSGRLKSVHRTLSVRSIRLLTPEVASVNIECEVSGAKKTDGSELANHKGLYAWILTRQDGQWLINVFHESDLPSAPPSP